MPALTYNSVPNFIGIQCCRNSICVQFWEKSGMICTKKRFAVVFEHLTYIYSSTNSPHLRCEGLASHTQVGSFTAADVVESASNHRPRAVRACIPNQQLSPGIAAHRGKHLSCSSSSNHNKSAQKKMMHRESKGDTRERQARRFASQGFVVFFSVLAPC